MSKQLIILDAGHGEDTKGKCSPLFDEPFSKVFQGTFRDYMARKYSLFTADKRLLEYKYAREIKERVKERLISEGFSVYDCCPEQNDIPLTNKAMNNLCRVGRANEEKKKHPEGALLVSIHSNAASLNGAWSSGRGWEAWVAKDASENSKKLAKCLYKAADAAGALTRKVSHSQPYHMDNWAICHYTNMPAVLVENFFHDNPDEVVFALSEKGKQRYTNIIVKGIKMYLNED